MINGWIMSGDTAVASFHGRVVTPILPERCPLCFQKGGDLEIWLESRAIDRHRTNSRILKRILRLGDTSVRSIHVLDWYREPDSMDSCTSFAPCE